MSKPIFNYRAHKKLWNFLAETGSSNKEEVIHAIDEELPRIHFCYACSAQYSAFPNSFCIKSLCPLDWGIFTRYNFPCEQRGGLYGKWTSAKTTEERRKIAARIRDLPLSKNARKHYEIIE